MGHYEMSFKQFLTESYDQKSAVKILNCTRLDADDLASLLSHEGPTGMTGKDNMGICDSVYSGFLSKTSAHSYFVLWSDPKVEDEDASYAITQVVVYLGEDGKLKADRSSRHIDSTLSEVEGKKSLKALKFKK
jgi:hypothetical protein